MVGKTKRLLCKKSYTEYNFVVYKGEYYNVKIYDDEIAYLQMTYSGGIWFRLYEESTRKNMSVLYNIFCTKEEMRYKKLKTILNE